MELDYLRTHEIKNYVYTCKEFYPQVNLQDYSEEFSCVTELACMVHRMIVGGHTCLECALSLRPEVESRVITRNGETFIETFSYCARCSLQGLK